MLLLLVCVLPRPPLQRLYGDGEVIGQAGEVYDELCIVAQVRGGGELIILPVFL